MLHQDSDRLAEEIGAVRRELLSEFMLSVVRRAGDLQLIHVATLYVLDTGRAPTVKDLADHVGRSVSATSRMVEQLVARGFVGRREDTEDRRAKRVHLTDEGREFLRGFERSRAEAQLGLMAYLSEEDQRIVARSTTLLAEAARRYRDEHRATAGEEQA
ncbi:MarR family winged helix-turn-helix transcriptional regulator [Allokutzneria albata]|uniref:DNA-binding transcriptional regulator, MarR family n=1 Tax=Allokutzneria albata TaxID=211114 RepID=A0A1G9ZKB0_ALLAB|nr:MarR family transcriptional regulator [Allokutzneria albata]SDN21748.1 DNA-binding transcriptional regulator, MarR family [Allokutzneria albata]